MRNSWSGREEYEDGEIQLHVEVGYNNNQLSRSVLTAREETLVFSPEHRLGIVLFIIAMLLQRQELYSVYKYISIKIK